MDPFVYADFIAAFPQFADTTKYPEESVNFWADVGSKTIDPCKWGNMYMNGLYMYVAHQITLDSKGAAGQDTGLVSSKSVGSASKSYDRASSNEEGAGYWNLTIWGQRYWRFVRMFGAGGLQV